MDSRFKVSTIAKTENPNKVIYTALHQCYSEGDSFCEISNQNKSEQWYGEKAIKALLSNDRGHFGCLETPSINFQVTGFPHSVMQQARTHRIGINFACQSQRYTSQRFLEYQVNYSLEDLIYIRPCGKYNDRNGNKLEYTEELRMRDINFAHEAILHYNGSLELGFAPEQARGLLPFDFRQNFVVTFNMRSLMHFLDLRSKRDAQLEITQLCSLLLDRFFEWSSEFASWYKETRYAKARLAP